MVNEHIKSCFTSLVIRKKQLQTTPIQMAKIKIINNTKFWQGCEKQNHSYITGKNEKNTASLDNNLACS